MPPTKPARTPRTLASTTGSPELHGRAAVSGSARAPTPLEWTPLACSPKGIHLGKLVGGGELYLYTFLHRLPKTLAVVMQLLPVPDVALEGQILEGMGVVLDTPIPHLEPLKLAPGNLLTVNRTELGPEGSSKLLPPPHPVSPPGLPNPRLGTPGEVPGRQQPLDQVICGPCEHHIGLNIENPVFDCCDSSLLP